MKNSEFNEAVEAERAVFALECERMAMEHSADGSPKSAYWQARAERLRAKRDKRPKLLTSPFKARGMCK